MWKITQSGRQLGLNLSTQIRPKTGLHITTRDPSVNYRVFYGASGEHKPPNTPPLCLPSPPSPLYLPPQSPPSSPSSLSFSSDPIFFSHYLLNLHLSYSSPTNLIALLPFRSHRPWHQRLRHWFCRALCSLRWVRPPWLSPAPHPGQILVLIS